MSSTVTIGNLPAAQATGATDKIILQQNSGTTQTSVQAFMASLAGASPAVQVDLSGQSVTPAGSTAAQTLASLASRIAALQITNIADLRALTSATTATTASVSGYATAADGGGGIFVVNTADTTSADNGGTIIVDAAGRRWYRVYSGAVNVVWFGADPTGTNDSTAAFNDALNSGAVFVNAYGNFLINGVVTVPSGVTLKGPYSAPQGIIATASYTYSRLPSVIQLGSAGSIIANERSTIEGLVFFSTPSTPATSGVPTFSGTAVTGAANASDITIQNSDFYGFTLAGSFSAGRINIKNVKGDCAGGFLIDNSSDISLCENVHFWPFLNTNTASGGALLRPGTFLSYTNGGSSWNRASNCFCFGYAVGYNQTSEGSVVWDRCGADAPAANSSALIGIQITGTYSTTNLAQGCQLTVGKQIVINTTGSSEDYPDLISTGNGYWGPNTTSNAYEVASGFAQDVNSYFGTYLGSCASGSLVTVLCSQINPGFIVPANFSLVQINTKSLEIYSTDTSFGPFLKLTQQGVPGSTKIIRVFNGNLGVINSSGSEVLTLDDGGNLTTYGFLISSPAVSSTSNLSLGTASTTTATSGTANALPSAPLGYLEAYLGSTPIRIPYYNA